MKVRATQLGYYNHVRRREGDVFTLVEMQDSEGNKIGADEQFSKRWMEKVDDDTPERYSTSQQEIKRLSAERRAMGEAVTDDPRPSNRPHARHDAGMSEATKEQARTDAKDARQEQQRHEQQRHEQKDAQQQRNDRQTGKPTGDRDVT